MFGQMMDRPLLISAILRHAESQHPQREIVSITADHPRHRYTFRAGVSRARASSPTRCKRARHPTAAIASRRSPGTTSGTSRSTTALSCSGFVCHTINPRLFEDQIAYIVNHAEDRWLFLDPAFVPLIEKLQPRLPKARRLRRAERRCAHAGDEAAARLQLRSRSSRAESDEFDWPEFDERTASSLCYTSGTTGDPKGVLYSHRSTLLHTLRLRIAGRDGAAAQTTSCMPVVPMFHVNAWALPYGCAMVGAKLVFPGPKMGDPETLQALIEEEHVTFTAGVPTVWQGVVAYLEKTGKRIDS